MNPPQVYMCSPSWSLLPPPSAFHPSGSSQCTSPKHPVSCVEPGNEFKGIDFSLNCFSYALEILIFNIFIVILVKGFFISVMISFITLVLLIIVFKKFWMWDFLGSPVSKTPCFQCSGPSSFPGQGTRSHMPQLTPSAAKQIN